MSAAAVLWRFNKRGGGEGGGVKEEEESISPLRISNFNSSDVKQRRIMKAELKERERKRLEACSFMNSA